MIGYAVCGSFCTHAKSLEVLKQLCKNNAVQPIFSKNAATIDTRFGKACDTVKKAENICSMKSIVTIEDAEPLGPSKPLDYLIICPCTGNTLAKIANGITDTPVTMAAKAHLRTDRPLLIALASNDALSTNLSNLSRLLTRKNVFFVPMFQDDPIKKPHSLVADFSLVSEAFENMKNGVQIRPIFK